MIETLIQCGQPQHDEDDAKLEGSGAITVPSSDAVVGGVVTERMKLSLEEVEEEEAGGADNEEPSLEVLIKQLEVSVNELEIVKARVNNSNRLCRRALRRKSFLMLITSSNCCGYWNRGGE